MARTPGSPDQGLRKRWPVTLRQGQAEVIKLNDRGDQAINSDRRNDCHDGKYDGSREQSDRLHRAQRNHNNFGGKDKIGANRPFDLSLFFFKERLIAFSGRRHQPFPTRRCLFTPPPPMMSNLLGSFVAEIEPAEHQQGRHETRKEFAQDKGCRHDNQLVEKGPRATAQTTGSSRRASTPLTCWALRARSSPRTPALFFAAIFEYSATSSSSAVMSSSKASRPVVATVIIPPRNQTP